MELDLLLILNSSSILPRHRTMLLVEALMLISDGQSFVNSTHGKLVILGGFVLIDLITLLLLILARLGKKIGLSFANIRLAALKVTAHVILFLERFFFAFFFLSFLAFLIFVRIGVAALSFIDRRSQLVSLLRWSRCNYRLRLSLILHFVVIG